MTKIINLPGRIEFYLHNYYYYYYLHWLIYCFGGEMMFNRCWGGEGWYNDDG